MDAVDAETAALIAERRKAIRNAAPCGGCGVSLAVCEANRGEGSGPEGLCCTFHCNHRQNPAELHKLINEIISGHVRSMDEILLELVREDAYQRRSMAAMLRHWQSELIGEDLEW